MARKVCLVPGDGIGPEVMDATRRVIDASGAGIDWITLPAGAAAFEKHGDVLPQQTLEAIDEHRLALKGPLTTPIGMGFTSINVRLRKHFNLYGAIRPVRSLPGVKTRFENVEIVVIRENTEGLYSGLEHEVIPDVIESLKVTTRKGCERIAKFAFEYAQERDRKKVTVFHKANIMKLSDGLFLDSARRVHENYRDIEYQEMIIDAGCMQVVRDPTQFDMLLLENYNGDVVSDLCAGLVGGLGVVPGANLGDDCAIFEAVHGSAPDIAGKGLANPLALLMSGVMMLNHLDRETGEQRYADSAAKIRNAYDEVLSSGKPEQKTRDIGGSGGTAEFTQAIVDRL